MNFEEWQKIKRYVCKPFFYPLFLSLSEIPFKCALVRDSGVRIVLLKRFFNSSGMRATLVS